MRAIHKGNEPACLTLHRANAHSDYRNYGGKAALRVALVAEQRGLCCYCMTRIVSNGEKMKIEHWRNQANYPDLQLSYGNLLGACPGGENGDPSQRTCDTRKGNQDLKWNPAITVHAIESRVRYQNDGEIRADDPEFDGQLDTVLNLNAAILKNNRKAVLSVVLEWWQKRKPSKAQVQARIKGYDNGNGDLPPFAPVAIWFLKRKVAA